MAFSFNAIAHGDKQKMKGLFKGIDMPAAKVVLAFHQAYPLVTLISNTLDLCLRHRSKLHLTT